MSRRTNACLRHLLPQLSLFHEWIVITAFYEAVHLVEEMFAHQGIDSHNHESRNDRLKEGYPEIFRSFSPLYMESRVARYMEGLSPQKTYAARMLPQNVKSKVVDGWLEDVRREVNKHLPQAPAQQAPPPPK